jgi:hypothetical protein
MMKRMKDIGDMVDAASRQIDLTRRYHGSVISVAIA